MPEEMITGEEALSDLSTDVNELEQDPETLVEDEDTEEQEEQEEQEEDDEIEELVDVKDNQKPEIPFDRPAIADIKAKYPNFFKDFPSLRDAFYREVEYTKLFPTVEDAKEAFEDNEAFSSLRESILAGDSAPLLDAVESQGKESLELFASQFLTKLYKKDEGIYRQVVTPLFENVVRSLYSSTDENDRNAALVISNYLFGTTEIAEGKKTFIKRVESPKTDETKDNANFQRVSAELLSRANTTLAGEVLKGLDPNGVLAPFIKKQVVRQIIEDIHEQLVKDPSHIAVMNARWKRAKLNNYSEEDKAKIITTFLARAKSILPSIRAKVVKDALGTQSSASKEKGERISRNIERKEVVGSKSSESYKSNGKLDYRKMSDLDILNS